MEEKQDKRGGARSGSGRKPRNEFSQVYRLASISFNTEILAQIEKSRGNISRHKWIIQAILEKLERDESR